MPGGRTAAGRPRVPRRGGRRWPVRPQGPRGLRTAQAGQATTVPPLPAGWTGTLPEWAVYWAHLRLGRQPGIHFVYQDPLAGGRLFRGGRVLDFVELDAPIAINVQGEYWHYAQGRQTALEDEALARQMPFYGYTLIFIDAADALRDAVYYVQEALRGIDHSRARQGRNS